MTLRLHVLQFFAFAHLPEKLQEVSRPFGELAERVALLPANDERAKALDKLLEAKDAAVRALHAKSAEKPPQPVGTFNCQRRVEDGRGPGSPFTSPGVTLCDHWRDDGSCSYCGSMNPVALIARLEAGDVQLTPTDKSYKVYVENLGGAAFKQSFRQCPPEAPQHGPAECSHWVSREISTTKFYFQHFDDAQCRAFIELLNAKKLKLAHPGHFYVRPFFIAPPAKAS